MRYSPYICAQPISQIGMLAARKAGVCTIANTFPPSFPPGSGRLTPDKLPDSFQWQFHLFDLCVYHALDRGNSSIWPGRLSEGTLKTSVSREGELLVEI